MIHRQARSSKQEPRDRRAAMPAFSRLLHAAIDAPDSPAAKRIDRKRDERPQPLDA